MGRRHRHQHDIVIRNQLRSLVVRIREPIRAQSRFVYDQVCNVLCVFNGAPRVVDASVTLAGLGMHAELNLVDAVAEAEDGHVCTLDCGDYFVHLALVLSALIVGGNGHEVSELLGGFKVRESDALVHLVEKADFVEGLLEVPPVHLVVHESLLGQEMQVLL